MAGRRLLLVVAMAVCFGCSADKLGVYLRQSCDSFERAVEARADRDRKTYRDEMEKAELILEPAAAEAAGSAVDARTVEELRRALRRFASNPAGGPGAPNTAAVERICTDATAN